LRASAGAHPTPPADESICAAPHPGLLPGGKIAAKEKEEHGIKQKGLAHNEPALFC
jgi:hypothetical protein